MTRPSGASTQLEKINFHFNVEALARQWVPPPPAPTSRRTPAVVAAAKGIAAVWGELTGSKARSWALAHELWLTLKDEPTVWYKPVSQHALVRRGLHTWSRCSACSRLLSSLNDGQSDLGLAVLSVCRARRRTGFA